MKKIEIKTFIGRKLENVNGILRRQIELDRFLKTINNLTLKYEYYNAPKNPVDFISKRFFLYPLRSKMRSGKNKDTIYHVTYQNIADLALFLNKSRTVITVHDIFYFLERNKFKNPVFVQRYSLLGLKRCRCVIAISEFTKKQLITRLKIRGEKIVVIKNGINTEMFKPIPEKRLMEVEPLFPNHRKVLHVGTEVYRKDITTLLKAFYIMKKHIKNIKLIRIGTPSHADLIRRLGLTKDITYINDISNERLNEIYNLCDFLLFPSLYEGWGAPGLEAAAAGTPVICSDIPIFREVYQEFPLYFSPGDYKSLANLVIKYIDDAAFKMQMSIKGRKTAQKYSWKISSMRYLNLCKNLLKNQA